MFNYGFGSPLDEYGNIDNSFQEQREDPFASNTPQFDPSPTPFGSGMFAAGTAMLQGDPRNLLGGLGSAGQAFQGEFQRQQIEKRNIQQQQFENEQAAAENDRAVKRDLRAESESATRQTDIERQWAEEDQEKIDQEKDQANMGDANKQMLSMLAENGGEFGQSQVRAAMNMLGPNPTAEQMNLALKGIVTQVQASPTSKPADVTSPITIITAADGTQKQVRNEAYYINLAEKTRQKEESRGSRRSSGQLAPTDTDMWDDLKRAGFTQSVVSKIGDGIQEGSSIFPRSPKHAAELSSLGYIPHPEYSDGSMILSSGEALKEARWESLKDIDRAVGSTRHIPARVLADIDRKAEELLKQGRSADLVPYLEEIGISADLAAEMIRGMNEFNSGLGGGGGDEEVIKDVRSDTTKSILRESWSDKAKGFLRSTFTKGGRPTLDNNGKDALIQRFDALQSASSEISGNSTATERDVLRRHMDEFKVELDRWGNEGFSSADILGDERAKALGKTEAELAAEYASQRRRSNAFKMVGQKGKGIEARARFVDGQPAPTQRGNPMLDKVRENIASGKTPPPRSLDEVRGDFRTGMQEFLSPIRPEGDLGEALRGGMGRRGGPANPIRMDGPVPGIPGMTGGPISMATDDNVISRGELRNPDFANMPPGYSPPPIEEQFIPSGGDPMDRARAEMISRGGLGNPDFANMPPGYSPPLTEEQFIPSGGDPVGRASAEVISRGGFGNPDFANMPPGYSPPLTEEQFIPSGGDPVERASAEVISRGGFGNPEVVDIPPRYSPPRPLAVSSADSAGIDPKIIEALIMTESGGKADAVGAAVESYGGQRAKGMVQFMAATGREYGLRIDDEVDERLVPELAVPAAARMMADLLAMPHINGDPLKAYMGYFSGATRIKGWMNESGEMVIPKGNKKAVAAYKNFKRILGYLSG